MTQHHLVGDFFCCAGGASTGLARAGFDVVGFDIEPQPRYPYTFFQGDALAIMDALLDGKMIMSASHGPLTLDSFSAFTASPPCQGYSVTKSVNPNASTYPLLIPQTRERFQATGKPWVIENVEGARDHMVNPLTLCGSQFAAAEMREGHRVYLRRHRLFESNFMIPEAGPHNHVGRAFPVFGNGVGGKKWPSYLKGPGTAAFARRLMGIDWTTREELDQAIPPAYTEYIGAHMMRAVYQNEVLAA